MPDPIGVESMKTVKSAHSCTIRISRTIPATTPTEKIKIISLDQDRLVSKFHGTLSLSDQCSTAIVAAAMPFNSARVSGVRVTWPAARFSRRWATDDVPGINRTLRDRCSSHASAT